MKRIIILLAFIFAITQVLAFYPNEVMSGAELRSRNIQTEYFCYFLGAYEFQGDLSLFFTCVLIQRTSIDEYTAKPYIVKYERLQQAQELVTQLEEDALRVQGRSRAWIYRQDINYTDRQVNTRR